MVSLVTRSYYKNRANDRKKVRGLSRLQNSKILALWLKTLELKNSKAIVKCKKKLSGKLGGV